jgi:hypothetical protein
MLNNLKDFEVTISKNQEKNKGLIGDTDSPKQEKKSTNDTNEIIREKEEDSKNMENKLISKKRGRKNKKEDNMNKKGNIHDKFSDDNLKRKVKTHFHIFVIAFLNMKIKSFLGKKYRFGKISSEITQNITVEFNQKLFDEKIKDVLVKISDKFQDKDKNKIILQILMSKVNENDEIVHLLNMTYKDMYNNYYLKSNKDTFKDENYDESYEAHLRKLENLYGKEYINNYKRNAQELISFFYKIKKRVRKKKFKGLIMPQLIQFSNNGNINNNYIDFLNKISNNMGHSKKLISTSTQTNIFISQDEDEDEIL